MATIEKEDDVPYQGYACIFIVCVMLVISGWYAHVFKVYATDLYTKANACERLDCVAIADSLAPVAKKEVFPPKLPKT